jgi:hypothetical protein
MVIQSNVLRMILGWDIPCVPHPGVDPFVANSKKVFGLLFENIIPITYVNPKMAWTIIFCVLFISTFMYLK